MNPTRKSCTGFGGGPAMTGLIITAVGVILLLNQLGIFPGWILRQFWPTVFLVIGILKLATGKDGGERVLGGVFVTLGAIFLVNNLGIAHISFHHIWPVLIIAGGVSLLFHAWNGPQWGAVGATTSGGPNMTYIFGGGDRRVDSGDFTGGSIRAIFGGFKIDLTRATIPGNEALLNVEAIFGGGEIRVPENWIVILEVVSIFGGTDDKTRHFQPDPATPAKTLRIRGNVIFGGFEIRN